jgi:GNAT superfamily N-acetyltransferase
MTATITTVPANEASADDLKVIFGTRGDPAGCQCQWFKYRDREFLEVPVEVRENELREQTRCGHPDADSTTGIVAYVDGEPAGWCAIEPRTAYPRLIRTRIPWQGRDEDKADATVWSVTCFVTRQGFRKQGVSRALAAASVPFARDRGARALEGYPMITTPGVEITWGELYRGSRSIFEAAGFTQVTHPTPRRVVMRIDFA